MYFRPSARIVSAKPGASRSITLRVASGVMSCGVRPGPAGREHQRHAGVDVVAQAILDQRHVVGHDLHGHDLAPRLLGGGGELRTGEVVLLTA